MLKKKWSARTLRGCIKITRASDYILLRRYCHCAPRVYGENVLAFCLVLPENLRPLRRHLRIVIVNVWSNSTTHFTGESAARLCRACVKSIDRKAFSIKHCTIDISNVIGSPLDGRHALILSGDLYDSMVFCSLWILNNIITSEVGIIYEYLPTHILFIAI